MAIHPEGTKSAAQMREEAERWRDAQPTTTICMLCDPPAKHTGTAEEGRTWALDHRVEEHPEAEHRPRRRLSPAAQKQRALERSEWRRERQREEER